MSEIVRPMSRGQHNELAKTLMDAIPELLVEEAQRIIQTKKALIGRVSKVLLDLRLPAPWKVIAGEYDKDSADITANALMTQGFIVTERARIALRGTRTYTAPTPIYLAKVRICDLGLSGNWQTYSGVGELIDRAEENGLTACPGAIGPLLRAYYSNQPSSESIFVMSNDLEIHFTVDRRTQGALFKLTSGTLDAVTNDNPNPFWWEPEHEFVFIRPPFNLLD